jgi:hypothetical protein
METTMSWACGTGKADKECAQNFGEITFWNTSTWKIAKIGDNIKMDISEMGCEDGTG